MEYINVKAYFKFVGKELHIIHYKFIFIVN